MSNLEIIIQKLQQIQPTFLEVIDETFKHYGHQGYVEGKSSHFLVRIQSELLSKMSYVAKHRYLYKLLNEEIETKMIHAISFEFV